MRIRGNGWVKIAGVICEYNPFHNGHQRHLRLTRERSGCDYIVCCMAGAFTQRGELAIVDKFLRAEMALRCGADAVVELPALFAVRTADVFAAAGVRILSALGADVLSFGAETADLTTLYALARLREEEPEALSQVVREGLRAGKSHARAHGEAVGALLGLDTRRPNAILAAEYLRAMQKQGSSMQPLAIVREGEYHDAALCPLASATAVRKAMREGGSVREAVPVEVWDLLESAPLSSPLNDLGLYLLRTTDLSRLVGAGEGLENRLKRAAQCAPTLAAVVEAVKCKRYTRARIERLVAAAMLGMDGALAARHPLPEYARLLGFRKQAQPLLAKMAQGAIPLVTRAAHLKGDETFALECRATDLWGLSAKDPALRAAGRDFTRRLIIL